MGNDRAVDFSATHPSPAELVGWDALSYLGRSRPSASYIRALTLQGSVFTFIFETDPNRAQDGWNAGLLDAVYAHRRADEVDYPRERNIVVVVSDGNRFSPSSGGDAIADYADAWVQQSARPCGPFYGNRYAVDAAIRGARRSGRPFISGPRGDGGWLPRTWDADPFRDPIIQEPNVHSPIGGTDFNSVHHDYTTGVAPAPDPTPRKDRAVVYDEDNPELDPEVYPNRHRYWVEHFAGLVELPAHATAARLFAGDIFVPVGPWDILDVDARLAAKARTFLGGGGGGAPVDVALLADAVADELAGRLQA